MSPVVLHRIQIVKKRSKRKEEWGVLIKQKTMT
jgi:hypothetical protein